MRRDEIESLEGWVSAGEPPGGDGVPIDDTAAFILASMPLVNPRRPLGAIFNLKAVHRLDGRDFEIVCEFLKSLLNRRPHFEAS